MSRQKPKRTKRYNPNRIRVRLPVTGLLNDFGIVLHTAYSAAALGYFSKQQYDRIGQAINCIYGALVLRPPKDPAVTTVIEGAMRAVNEAYIGDISRPLKQLLPDYKVIEERVERAIFPIFGIQYPLSRFVKSADLCLLATEQRDLMPEHDDEWALIKEIQPMQERIEPWTSEQAFRAFMQRYEELGGVVG